MPRVAPILGCALLLIDLRILCAQQTVAPPVVSLPTAPTSTTTTPPAGNTTNAAATTATPTAGNSSASGNFSGQWKSPTGEGAAPATTANPDGLAPIGGSPRAPVAKVTSGTGSLPNQHGQVWRDYDISPYTARVTSTNRPEQALVDWILRETGYEAWHSGVVSVLGADARTLHVYHTPEIQALVADIVDRFVRSEGDSQAVGVRIISIDGPNWRIRAQQALRPVPVQTQGIQAWLMAREDASLLTAEMRKRSDFREHGSPQLLINSGQSAVVGLTRPRPYTADVAMRNDAWPGYEAKAAQYDEGFSIEISPLAALDGKSLDAVLKVNIDQLERLQSIDVDVPSAVQPRQRTRIDVPQVSEFRLHDRFRWPVDQVLLVSLGVVPIPAADQAGTSTLGGIKLPSALSGGPDRGEMLLFIEAKSAAALAAPGVVQPAAPPPAVTPTSIIPNILGNLPNVPLTPSRPRY